MNKKLEVLLGDTFFNNGKNAIRVTSILYVNEKTEVSQWERTVRLTICKVTEANKYVPTDNTIDLTFEQAAILSTSIKKINNRWYDPQYNESWDKLISFPDWAYVDKDEHRWWHEKPPPDASGNWMKYKDYIEEFRKFEEEQKEREE